MLELHKIKRVPYVVVYLTVFILFDERSLQEGVFKVMKNDHFLVFFAV